jgi:glycosyltransferase involved in cell wall biosynthesis
MLPETKPFKILMTADTMGGVWTYALALIKALEPTGAAIALATMGALLTETQHEQIKGLPQVKLYESAFKLEWMESPWEEVEAAGNWLLQINREFVPDLIHLNNLVHGHLNWGKPVVVVVHSCVLSWWQSVKQQQAPVSWQTYRERVTRSLRAADVVVAPSRAMLEAAQTQYGIFERKKVIANGCDPAWYLPGPKEPFVFSMGRLWDEAKNITLLTEVAAALSWPVYVAGEVHHPATGQMPSLPNIYFLGALTPTEVAGYLSRASIFTLPAKYEPFGLSALEAALSGCALVLGDIASQREIWQQAATYVDPHGAETLKTALTRLIADESIRSAMGLRARQAGLYYPATRMATEYGRIYRQLTSTCRPWNAPRKAFLQT